MSDLFEFDLASRGVTTKYLAPTGIYSLILTSNVAKVTLPCGSATANALAFDADTAKWVIAAATKLDALGKLRRNWDSYDGLPLSADSRRITFDALGWLKYQDLPTPAVVLGSNGTVSLEWYSNGKELEIGFGENGSIEYCKIESNGNAEEGEEDRDIRQKLTVLAKWLRSSH